MMPCVDHPDLVVLDIDGTVVRLPVDWAQMRARLRAVAAEHRLGLEVGGVLGTLTAVRELDAPAARAEMEGIVADAERRAARHAPANAALREWVLALPPGTRLAALSLNCRDAVDGALDRAGLAEAVGERIGREDVRRPKPDPEGLLELIRRAGVAPGRTLMVGDSSGDHECARAAGARSLDVTDIGVRWEG